MVRRGLVLLTAAAGLASGTALTPAERAAAEGHAYVGGPAVASIGTSGELPGEVSGEMSAEVSGAGGLSAEMSGEVPRIGGNPESP